MNVLRTVTRFEIELSIERMSSLEKALVSSLYKSVFFLLISGPHVWLTQNGAMIYSRMQGPRWVKVQCSALLRCSVVLELWVAVGAVVRWPKLPLVSKAALTVQFSNGAVPCSASRASARTWLVEGVPFSWRRNTPSALSGHRRTHCGQWRFFTDFHAQHRNSACLWWFVHKTLT